MHASVNLHAVTAYMQHYSPGQYRERLLPCGGKIKLQYEGPCTNREPFSSVRLKQRFSRIRSLFRVSL